MTDDFEAHRPRLLSLAYRLLGSWAEAEDAVQDTHERWLRREAGPVLSPRAFLDRAVTNRCLDQLKSARAQRETYVGPWLPEPVDLSAAPLSDEAVNLESISLAFLTLLERLSPLERAAFILAEVFDYDTKEVAAVLAREEPAVRQLLHRARAHVEAGRPRFAPSREAHSAMLGTFLAAVAQGDVTQVEALLAKDARARSDGGGKARAALNDIVGADKVARFLIGLSKKANAGMLPALRDVNGSPGVALMADDGTLWGVIDVETDGEKVYTVSMVLNPDKLRAMSRA